VHSELLLEHFRNPRNIGQLPPPAITVDVTNPACGDLLRLSALFQDGKVTEARFQVRGCTASIAAGSALSEWMLGKTRAELHGLTAEISSWLSAGWSRLRSTRRRCAWTAPKP
jgi:nitrogen fixation NifU-like protein